MRSFFLTWTFLAAAFVGGSLAMSGCGSINCDLVAAVKASDDVILPRYQAYIEADPDLPDAAKAMALRHIEERRALVDREAALCE
jgi:hypothetical protein